MGYEIKIYVGTVHESQSDEGAAWFSIVGMVDICKPGYGSNIYKLQDAANGKPPVFFYGTDGNTQMREDCYGTKLVAYKPADVLAALKKDAKADNYRRFPMAVDFLSSSIKNMKDERLAVVLYGY